MRKHRMFGIDFIRIICALLIYMGHSVAMFGCSYGSGAIDNFILGTRSPVMSMFFIVSGFSIYYNNKVEDWNTKETVDFYIKRAINIFPTVLLIHVLWLVIGPDTVARWIVLTPLSISGLQSMFPNILGILHNGGTWFISCILIAYFTFPISCGIIDTFNKRTKWVVTVAVMLAVIYFSTVGNYYSLGNLYINPIFRCLEFTFGVCLSASFNTIEKRNGKLSTAAALVALIVFTVIVGHSIWYQTIVSVTGVRTTIFVLYPWIALMLYISYITRCVRLENNVIINYASGLTYYFFIFQLILWIVTTWFVKLVGPYMETYFSINSIKLISSFVICVLISIIVCELYDKPIKKKLRSVLSNK